MRILKGVVIGIVIMLAAFGLLEAFGIPLKSLGRPIATVLTGIVIFALFAYSPTPRK